MTDHTWDLDGAPPVHVDAEESDGLPPSWHGLPLADVLSGSYEPPKPTVLTIAGTGQGLFYKGRTNGVIGDSGAGKTWVGIKAARQAIKNGLRVLYVDLEDGPHLFAYRLGLLGCTADDIITTTTYLNPSEAVTAAQVRRIANTGYALVVIDGVTGYYGLHGWDIDAARDAEELKIHTDQYADAGSCVMILDHTGKSREGRSWGLGSQHKKSAITGAMYRIEPVAGQDWNAADGGTHTLTKVKDRPGGVPVRNEDEAARLHMRPGHPLEIVAMPGKGWLL